MNLSTQRLAFAIGTRAWRVVYNLVAIPMLFFSVPLLALLPARSGSLLKIRNGVRGRKGWYESLRAQLQPYSNERPRVWIHAASMGECEQAKPILRELGARLPHAVRVLTIFSPSAMRHITRENFPAEAICYLPFDSLLQVRKFFNAVQPSAGIVIRHDYWPNFMWEAKRRGVRLLLADASVSANANSFRHKPLVRNFNREVLAQFDTIAAVSAFAAENLRPLLRYPERLRVLGDTRYEQVLHRVQHAAPQNILPPSWSDLKFHLVAGSTWPADEEVLIPAFAAARERFPYVRMILVPHEPTATHLQNAERLLHEYRLTSVRLSHAHQHEAAEVLLVDRIGVLAELYGSGQIAYVGGAFGPGVHSVLEAAAHGVPVLFGPRHHNSAEAVEMAQSSCGKMVSHRDDCARALEQLWLNEKLRAEQGRACRAFVEQKTGAAQAMVSLLVSEKSINRL